MLENAVRICDAKFGYIYRWDGDAFDLVATYNVPPAFAERAQGFADSSQTGNAAWSHVGDKNDGSRRGSCG